MSIDARCKQLQFPFMTDVNQRMYNAAVVQDFNEWVVKHEFTNIPVEHLLSIYAESTRHRFGSQKLRDWFFADADFIIPYASYDRRPITRD